ncbi:tail fiber protein [Reichenbachiella ulvae]|uniref:Tail fiber protein n=1 Tax=Reichenbachiella ulvae TaxID=2980104 RepID=A0ABT3CV42_9BACT|nr:tail fiber protein [Reichenbachiella ulvae]MCV9387472.1 tail fiber protein [Reichenbachiella ulvae]
MKNQMKYLLVLLFAICLVNASIAQNWNDTGDTSTTDDNIKVNGYLMGYDVSDHLKLFVDNAGEYSRIQWGDDKSDRLSFYFNFHDGTSSDREVMTLLSNGKVGIGKVAPSTKLEVSGSETTNRISQSGGTYTELAQRAWSGSAGILFSAYASNGYVNGGLVTTGNTKYKFNAQSFGSSYHGAKMIYTDHSSIRFYISPPSTGADQDVNWGTAVLSLYRGGKVGVGTTNPTSMLSVAGKMDAQEIKVLVGAGVAPDYVFADDYKLTTLEETAEYIQQNRHLPEIPSAAEMEANGVELGEMNMLLLKKIEELTLHLIEKDEQLKKVKARLAELEK